MRHWCSRAAIFGALDAVNPGETMRTNSAGSTLRNRWLSRYWARIWIAGKSQI